MAFECPGCGARVDRGPGWWATSCPSCRRVIRIRAADTSGPDRAYDVEIAGRPETRRRITVAWTPEETRRLRRWLAWATTLTLGLVLLLYAAARWAR